MSKKDLSREPQNVDEYNWYYEGSSGIEIVHKTLDGYGFPKNDHIIIPWRKLKASLKRLEK